MYERSAIVLERYMEKILKLNKQYNLKKNNENYSELISEIENYQNVTEKELEVIQEFDDTAKEIENLQQDQEKLYKANKNLEDERAQLFTELGEEAEVLDVKLKKIEDLIGKNNQKLKEIRTEFVKNLTDFSKKQKNRNKCEKARRIGEANHIAYVEKMNIEFNELDVKDIVSLKDFMNFEKDQIRQEILQVMIKNGKNERVPFNQEVLKRAIKVRMDIAEKEAECYIAVYEKMKKLLAEPDSETIRLNKYKKTLRDTSVKLAFLNAQREYIVGFLDYERMTAISGEKVHKKMMIDACNNFELDIMQIDKLYELIMRETNNRSTKKGYNQLYNKTYLKNIEDKEKNFEQEVNNVNISMGTVINSNYWRIEGIKNIYNVFQEEVSQKFDRDLSEYRIDEPQKVDEIEEIMAIGKPKKNNITKKEKEEHYKQFQYDEYGKYDEYDYEEDEQIDTYKEDSYEEKTQADLEEYQYKIDDYQFDEPEDYEEEKDDNRYPKNYIKQYLKDEEEDEEDTQEEYHQEYLENNQHEYNEEEDDEEDYKPDYKSNYNEKYDDEYDEEEYEEEEEDYQEEIYEEDDLEETRYPNYQSKVASAFKPRAYLEEEEEETNEYEDNYQEENYEEENYEDNEEDEKIEYNNYANNYAPKGQEPSNYPNNYEENYEEDYEEENDNNYEKGNYEEDYEEDYDNQYYDDDYEDVYQAYSNKNRKSYLEEDDDDEYENIYEYNYDDDEEEYRKQKLKNKTVISFDDEESIDMIIANSRKKSSNRKNNAKGLFNKLFKK
ncbi:MAG: hypothetical protein HFJ34_00915 [Clostridia bacterium]|nr:hypothetical protein [Clostridia bacterium]